MTSQNAKRLIVTTPSDREIVITCAFDAPPDLVLKAYDSEVVGTASIQYDRRQDGC